MLTINLNVLQAKRNSKATAQNLSNPKENIKKNGWKAEKKQETLKETKEKVEKSKMVKSETELSIISKDQDLKVNMRNGEVPSQNLFLEQMISDRLRDWVAVEPTGEIRLKLMEQLSAKL